MNDCVRMRMQKYDHSQVGLLDMSGSQFESLHEIIAKARLNLTPNVWDYICGGSETETTVRRNRLALDSLAFRPRVLRDVHAVETSRSILGRLCRLPVLLAPVAALEIISDGGAAASAQAAAQFGVPFVLSSGSAPGLEATAEAVPDSLRVFQLYVRGDQDFVDDHVRRAMSNGYAAFCLTVDTAHYSRRERDIDKRYVRSTRANVSGEEYQAGLTWSTIGSLTRRFEIPLMIKGIATAEDARVAVEHGVAWVWVSNHGGRQLDHGRGSIEVLPEIVEAVKGRAKIIVDGSINRGTDVLKAVAVGAHAVAIGRMQCFGLAASGTAGVVRTLEILEDEVKRNLGLLGVATLDALDASYLHPAQPTNWPDVLSAFPLLRS